jgi:Domain of unknown function (DUF4382)
MNAQAGDNDAGWSDITLSPPRKIDLFSLINGVLTTLGQTAWPAGQYQQVRLVLATLRRKGRFGAFAMRQLFALQWAAFQTHACIASQDVPFLANIPLASRWSGSRLPIVALTVKARTRCSLCLFSRFLAAA